MLRLCNDIIVNGMPLGLYWEIENSSEDSFNKPEVHDQEARGAYNDQSQEKYKYV